MEAKLDSTNKTKDLITLEKLGELEESIASHGERLQVLANKTREFRQAGHFLADEIEDRVRILVHRLAICNPCLWSVCLQHTVYPISRFSLSSCSATFNSFHLYKIVVIPCVNIFLLSCHISEKKQIVKLAIRMGM